MKRKYPSSVAYCIRTLLAVWCAVQDFHLGRSVIIEYDWDIARSCFVEVSWHVNDRCLSKKTVRQETNYERQDDDENTIHQQFPDKKVWNVCCLLLLLNRPHLTGGSEIFVVGQLPGDLLFM